MSVAIPTHGVEWSSSRSLYGRETGRPVNGRRKPDARMDFKALADKFPR